jgi:hypothetical protein
MALVQVSEILSSFAGNLAEYNYQETSLQPNLQAIRFLKSIQKPSRQLVFKIEFWEPKLKLYVLFCWFKSFRPWNILSCPSIWCSSRLIQGIAALGGWLIKILKGRLFSKSNFHGVVGSGWNKLKLYVYGRSSALACLNRDLVISHARGNWSNRFSS